MRFYMSLDCWLNHKIVRSSRMASLFSCKCFLLELLKWSYLGHPQGKSAGGCPERAGGGREGPSGAITALPALATSFFRSTFPETRSTELTVCWRDVPRAAPPGQRGVGGGADAPASWGGVCCSGWALQPWSHPVFQEAPGTPGRYCMASDYGNTCACLYPACAAHSEGLVDNLKHRPTFFLRCFHMEGPSPYQCTDTWHDFLHRRPTRPPPQTMS